VNARIDLKQLAARESEQVEWKENVADEEDVVATIVAFGNDLANLGGGYVVCGAQEGKDAHRTVTGTAMGKNDVDKSFDVHADITSVGLSRSNGSTPDRCLRYWSNSTAQRARTSRRACA
jgi:hypothetical protein